MQVSTEKKEGVQSVLTVTVPAADVKAAYDNSFRKCAKTAKVDGFRKGHIPAKLIEQYFEIGRASCRERVYVLV